MDCRSGGVPTDVLPAELNALPLSWSIVHDEIAKVTTTCAYDRSGMDWSDPVDQISDAKEVSKRLYKLMEVAEVNGQSF